MKPAKRRELVGEIRQAYKLKQLRACGLIQITRWSNRYQSRRDPQTELRVRLRDLASTRIRYGYRRLTVLLRREGWHVIPNVFTDSTEKKGWSYGYRRRS